MSFLEIVSVIVNSNYFGYFLHAIEIVVAELIMASFLKKRKYFVIRLIITLIIFFALSIFLGVVFENIFPYIRYLVSFFCSLFILPACFKANIWDEVYYSIEACIIQNLSYLIATVFVGFFGWNSEEYALIPALVQMFVYCIVHLAFFIPVLKKIKKSGTDFGVERISMILLSLLFVIINYVIQHDRQSLYTPDFFWWRAVFIAFDILFLYSLVTMYDKGQIRKENEVLEQIRSSAANQYETEKHAIEIINIKNHDLKRQIFALKNLGDKDFNERIISEVEDAVMDYDSIAKTGSEPLDVVLTNKYLLCEKNNIRLTYIADGKLLSFMNSVDIFLLFDNALENAIRAVSNVEDKEKRVINLTCTMRSGFLFINIENYCENELVFKNGLPQTTQNDTSVHGFGMLSMRHTVENYGGVMSAELADNMFSLNFTIPLKAKK